MTIPEEKRAGYITLKEAGERFGYTPDYLGQLIRKGKIEGKLVYSHVAWVTTPEAIEEYISGEKDSEGKSSRKKGTKNTVPQTESSTVDVHESITIEHDATPREEIENNEVGLLVRFFKEKLFNERSSRIMIVALRIFLALIVITVLFFSYMVVQAFGDERTSLLGEGVTQVFELSVNNDHHATR